MTLELTDWMRIRDLFLRYGFSTDEAHWAAENNLDPMGPKGAQIKKLLRNRKTKVRTLMKISGYTKQKVIDSLDDMRREKCLKDGFDEMDLFQGESP